MAAVDDIYNQITRNSRKRTGRSFFPAVNKYDQFLQTAVPADQLPDGSNKYDRFLQTAVPADQVIGSAARIYRGININARPSANAINSTPQGQIIQMSGEGSAYSGAQTGGYGPGRGALPPDQNPAYQAAIAKGRPNTSSYVWLQSPDGIGKMRVPAGSVAALNQAMPGSYVNPTGPLSPAQYASSWMKGYGAPAPSFNQATGTLANKGVETPLEQLTPQQRSVLPGANPLLQQWGANFAAQNPKLAAFGTLALNAFNGLRGTLNTPAGNQYANNLSTGQLPSQPIAQQPSVQSQNFYNYNPSPAPPPRRYSDLGYY